MSARLRLLTLCGITFGALALLMPVPPAPERKPITDDSLLPGDPTVAEQAATRDSRIAVERPPGSVRVLGDPRFRSVAYRYYGKECIAFSADGTRVAAVACDWTGEVVVWEYPSGRTVCRFAYGSGGTFDELRFAEDGAAIVGVGYSEDRREVEVRSHDAATGKLLTRAILPGLDSKKHPWVAIAADGKTLLGWNEYADVLRKYTIMGGVEWVIPLESTLEVAASADGRWIVTTACEDEKYQVRSFDGVTGRAQARVDLPEGGLRPVFATSGYTFALVSRDFATISLWDARTLSPTADFPLIGRGYPIALSPNGQWLAVQIRYSSGVHVYDTANRREAYWLYSGDRNKIVFTPDSKTLAFPRGALELYDAATGKMLPHSADWSDLVRYESVYFSPDGRTLTALNDGWSKVITWDVASGRELARGQGWKPERWLKDGHTLGRPGGQFRFEQAPGSPIIEIRERPSGKLLKRVRITSRIEVACISPDLRTFAASAPPESRDRTIYLYETATGRVRHSFDPGERWDGGGGFSPDGRLLATLHRRNPVVLWNVRGDDRRPTAPPDAAGWAKAWESLGGDDAKAAFQAIRLFAAFPDRGLPLLKAEAAALRPPTPPAPTRVAELIEQLGSDDYQTREAASRELAALGRFAEPALRAATISPSPEVRDRIRVAFAGLSKPFANEVLAVRVVEAVEWAGTADAAQLLELWAAGPPNEPLTIEAIDALARVKRR